MKSSDLVSSLSFVGLTTVGMLLAGTQSAIAITLSDPEVDNLNFSQVTSSVTPTDDGSFKYSYVLKNLISNNQIKSFILPLLGNTEDYVRNINSPTAWTSSGVKSGAPNAWPSNDSESSTFKTPAFHIEWTTTGGLGYLAEAEFSFESDYQSTKAPYVAFWSDSVSEGINYTVGDPPVPSGSAAVPAPSLLLGVMGMGVQMWRKKRQQLDA